MVLPVQVDLPADLMLSGSKKFFKAQVRVIMQKKAPRISFNFMFSCIKASLLDISLGNCYLVGKIVLKTFHHLFCGRFSLTVSGD